MGAIGRWIDERCQAEPDVMRRVLGRKFGDLGNFFEPDGKCGCLVGSYLMESRGQHAGFVIEEDGQAIGYQVAFLGGWLTGKSGGSFKYGDSLAIRLLKQRIRKALGLAPSHRETEVLVGSGETPQP